MTARVIEVINLIKNEELFLKNKLFFAGGTVLSYYINHRISEDIDIVSPDCLPYKSISDVMFRYGAKAIKDEYESALRMAGLFPSEFMLKFNLNGVKVEFFRASTKQQLEIISNATLDKYDNSNLSMLDLKSVAKLKIIALLQRNKSRDLFDFEYIIKKNILTKNEILNLSKDTNPNIVNLDSLCGFINNKTFPKDDEMVYLSELEPIGIDFEDIKSNTLQSLKEL